MAVHAHPEHFAPWLGLGYKNVPPLESKLCKGAAPSCYHESWATHKAPSYADCAALANDKTSFGSGPGKHNSKTTTVFKKPNDVDNNCGVALWVDPDGGQDQEVSFTPEELAAAAKEINDFCFGESSAIAKAGREKASKKPDTEWNVGACNMHGYSVFLSSNDGFTTVEPVVAVDGAGNPITNDVTRTLKKRARETASA